MGVKFSKYSLIPCSRLNRFEITSREGCYFSLDDKLFLDYCPWIQFGDLSVDDMILSIKESNDIPKLFSKLFEIDSRGIQDQYKSFLNHDLNIQKHSKYIKVKCDESTDLTKLISSFSSDNKLRLDFNNALTPSVFKDMFSKLDNQYKNRIDYIEDPFIYDEQEWTRLQQDGIKLGTDRNIRNEISHINIYKPGIDLDLPINTHQDIIFSSYMGSELNTFHTYLEASDKADLSLRHGIYLPTLFEDQFKIIKNITEDRYVVDKISINELYNKLKGLEWTTLI
jgi:hypothetical protein